MAPELGGSQISQLLESVPGIASVLRSPVADAMVNLVRAAAGVEEFDRADAQELIQYAVRRGLISGGEGDRVLGEIRGASRARRAKSAPKRGGVKKGGRKAKRSSPVKKAAHHAKRR